MAAHPLFLDTSYVLALFNTRDQWHSVAVEWQQRVASAGSSLVTTELVLVEIGDSLASVNFRSGATKIIRTLLESELVNVVAASSELFEKSFDLYESRADKDWGLTDCSSFIVMTENQLTDALSTDDHFRQAGFNPLLRSKDLSK